MDIAGASALVTGAASGLGRATAQALADRGAHVVGLDLPSAVESTADASSMKLVAADVTDYDALALLMRDLPFEGELRVVVNCAGVAPSERIIGRRGLHNVAKFARVVSVNLVGTFAVMTQGAAIMAGNRPDEDGQRGVVVNTASIAAQDGQVGQAAYAASKAGVAGLTLPAARDLADVGIRVCAIAPGIIDTPMLAGVNAEFRASLAAGVPFPARLGRSDEYAALVLSIVDNNYLNGEVIRMDGALRMAPR